MEKMKIKFYHHILWLISLVLMTNGILKIRESGFSIWGWLPLSVGVFYLFFERVVFFTQK